MKYIRTPDDIWESLSSEFNFTIDACASDKNNLVDKYWTAKTDALKQDWDNEIPKMGYIRQLMIVVIDKREKNDRV